MFVRRLSPLRYPGGKAKMAPYAASLMEASGRSGAVYVEPFCGGAGVAFELLHTGMASRIILNDLDRAIYAFWFSVLNQAKELCALIETTPVTVDEWREQKEVQARKESADLLELGFSTLFLNRVNRSGIIRNGGIIGGIAQAGSYKLDCRYPKYELIKRISAIAALRDRIELHNLDAEVLIDNVITPLEDPAFIFFDPPYYAKGASLYMNAYTHERHVSLRDKIANIRRHYWLLTYDDTPEIAEMYKGYRQEKHTLNYSAQVKRKGDELAIFSDNLILPLESLAV